MGRWVDPIPELKRDVAAQVARLLDGWAAHDAAALIGTDQPRISDIRRGKLDRFSLETLIRHLSRLQHTVELRAAPTVRAPVRAAIGEARGARPDAEANGPTVSAKPDRPPPKAT